MLKTISAALLAVSVIAAPALAASTDKTATAPAAKTAAPVIKSEQTKSKALNANAKMGHHSKHVRHHRSHKHMGVVKTHATPRVAVKPIAPAKRG